MKHQTITDSHDCPTNAGTFITKLTRYLGILAWSNIEASINKKPHDHTLSELDIEKRKLEIELLKKQLNQFDISNNEKLLEYTMQLVEFMRINNIDIRAVSDADFEIIVSKVVKIAE